MATVAISRITPTAARIQPTSCRGRLTFDHLRSPALGPGDSVALIQRVAAQTQRGAGRGRHRRRLRKSSFSGGDTGNGTGCVEVAFLPGGGVAIRDTKDRALAPHVHTAAERDAFVAGVRAGEFDRPTA